ncbi:MAG: hypothetical protein M3Y55_07710, partial [Pseudomonadota bacterium]|nr:hypothetical protein [Pseudomonadota bacterium]
MPTQLVPVFKDLFWSLLVSRPDGQPYALSHAAAIFHRLRYLARWMEQRKRHSLASISPAFVDAFVSDLKAHLKKEGKKREAEYTTGSVVSYLKTLDLAFEQRAALAARGHEGIGIQPFGEASAWGVAEEIAPYVESFTPPIPDELVLPIVSAAYRFIREVADDAIELQTRILASESRLISKKNPRKISHKQFGKLRPAVIREFAEQRARERPWLAELLVGRDDDDEG